MTIYLYKQCDVDHIFICLLQNINSAKVAMEALRPFANDSQIFRTQLEVLAAVKIMENALPFAYDDQDVSLHG